MRWLLGAGMGFLLGGPLGAVVGGVLQHMVTKDMHNTRGALNQSNHETVFVTNLAAIMTKIAMADGRINPEEVQTIHNFFAQKLGYTGEDLEYIYGIIKETERVKPDLWKICYAFRQYAGYDIRILLLDLAYQIAITDRIMSDAEQREINIVASLIGISEEEHQQIKNKYLLTHKKDSYSILGLKQGASLEDIKKAYRVMAGQYHPDKVSHLGKELIDFANQKFREINKAYEELKKEKDF
jgi:DnaJ like chaperone protein